MDLETLRTKDMKIESAIRQGAKTSGEDDVNKMGKYSF